jgi:hypothetical protein
MVFAEGEGGMHGGDAVVEFGEGGIVEVEAAVFEDVDFGASKNAEVFVASVEVGDLFELFEEARFVEAVGLERGLRVVGDAEVLEAEVDGFVGHFVEGGVAIGGGGVVVKGAAELAQLDEARQGVVGGGFDFAGVFAQLGWDEVEA